MATPVTVVVKVTEPPKVGIELELVAMVGVAGATAVVLLAATAVTAL